MMSRHCSALTMGFLKKLPTLPISAGSGSLARRIAAHPVEDRACVGRGVAGLGHAPFQVQVAQHRPPGPRQAQPHAGDQALAGQAAEAALLEDAVAVAERTGPGVQRHGAAGDQVDRVQRLEAVLQLQPVGADVLHRRRAHGAGDQRQVLQPRPALVQRPGDDVVPVLAGTGLDDPGVVALAAPAGGPHLDRSTTACGSRLSTRLLPPPSTSLGRRPSSGWPSRRRTSASPVTCTSVCATAGRPKLL
jgi:hypothetical protein